ncbi:hypothetical protein [Prescottella agglutinans]|uniref:hypothetical protein n=1 Tax=Prescottella agglutinans TaxID=1644129 RepID=UPI000FDD0B5B|nr:hypothetical protein [Prescottella agglutinans]
MLEQLLVSAHSRIAGLVRRFEFFEFRELRGMHHANRTPKHPSTDPVTGVWSHAKIDPTAGHGDNHDDPLQTRKRGYSLKLACGSSAAAALPPVLLEAAAIVTATTALIIFLAVILAALAI